MLGSFRGWCNAAPVTTFWQRSFLLQPAADDALPPVFKTSFFSSVDRMLSVVTCRPWTVKHWGSACQAQEHIRPYNYSKNPIACWTFCLNAVDKVLNACWSKCWRHLNEHFCSESLFGYKCLVKNQSWKQLMGVSREVRGIPVVQYNEQNRIIFNNPKTDFIAVTTNFTKQDHLQLIKVLNSCKLTD